MADISNACIFTLANLSDVLVFARPSWVWWEMPGAASPNSKQNARDQTTVENMLQVVSFFNEATKQRQI